MKKTFQNQKSKFISPKCQVLLTNPPFSDIVFPRQKESEISYFIPLGLAYIATNLKKNGIIVEALDANALGMDISSTIGEICRSQARIVGFTVSTMIINIVYDIAKAIKEKRPDFIIIVGGPHVTFTIERTFQECSAIDYIVIGEGDFSCPELAGSLLNSKDPSGIKGVAGKNADGSIWINSPPPPIKNLDSLEFPAWEMFPIYQYRIGVSKNIGYNGNQFATMITSRGCPNRCTFCSSKAFWKTFRMRSADNVLAEIEYLVEKQGVKHIFFVDDTIMANKNRLRHICQGIIDKKWDLNWNCYGRIKDANYELMRLMRRAGCFYIYFGVESGNQKVLDSVQKNIRLENVKQVIHDSKRAGIITNCSFILGLPGDNSRTMEDTVKFAITLNPHMAEFYFATPFPGTLFYEQALRENWLRKDVNWKDYSLYEGMVIERPDLASEVILKKVSSAYKHFYMRISYFWLMFRLLLQNKYAWRIILRGAKVFLKVFKHGKL